MLGNDLLGLSAVVPVEGPPRVRCGLLRPTDARSALGGEADEIGAKADLPAGMSAVGGGADVACQGLSGPFIARTGHARCHSKSMDSRVLGR